MLELNRGLQVRDLARTYAERGRIQVREFLTAPAAEQLHDVLRQTPWGLVCLHGGKALELDAAALKALPPQEAVRLLAAVRAEARTGYQFLYAYYPLFRMYFTPGAARHPLFDAYEFMNSAPVLAFVRQLTGLSNIRWADGQATLFRPGHFLRQHTDHVPSERRAAAYVLNMTRDWQPDWGGYLQFFDKSGDVEHAFKPAFNALNIFTIPADHSVEQVANFAGGDRMAITGWFREDEPPGPIGR